MRSTALLALAVAAVSAQSQNYTSSLDMTVNPGTVSDDLKAEWCRAQSNTCTTLCDDDAGTNDCEFTDLSYECLCSANNSAPGLQYYQQTMPTFICKQLFEQCIVQYANDADGQDGCKENIDSLCGTADPADVESGGDDEDEDDGGDDSSETSATAPEASATETTEEGSATSTDADDFAAATAAPKGMAALAAFGIVAALV